MVKDKDSFLFWNDVERTGIDMPQSTTRNDSTTIYYLEVEQS